MIGREARVSPNSLYTRSSGLDRPKKFERMINLHGTKWIMFCGLLDISLGSLIRGGSEAKLLVVVCNQIVIGFRRIILPWCGLELPSFLKLSKEYVVVPQHGLLPFYTKLEGPSITKNVFLFPSVFGHWTIFKGP